MPEDNVDKLHNVVDKKRGSYIQLLKEAVAIRSEKGDQYEARNMLSWAEAQLKSLDASTTLHDVGSMIIDGKKINLPPVLIADLKSESSKDVLLVYGHLDTLPSCGPVRSSTGSNSSTQLIEEGGVLFGKGVTDSKGPLLCWFNAIQAYRDLEVDIPISIRFLIEVMKESGSLGLLQYLHDNKGFIFKNVSYICISDSSCLASSKPVLTYGLRGCCKFNVTVEGGKVDLHSGVHGGMVAEPMTDLINIMSSLTNNKGEILIPNIRDNVEDVTPDEEKAYHKLTFDIAAFKNSIGVEKLLHKEDKKRLLMHRSRFPSLSIHGISSGDDPFDDTLIPCKVTGSFTIRIVPNQTPEETFHKVQLYLMFLFNKTQSPNQMTIEMPVAIPPWLAKPDDSNYKAATKAIYRVYKQEPDLIREGSSIPIVAELQKASGKSVLLLPVGYSDHFPKKSRDKIDMKTFMDGTKVVAAYIYELSQTRKGT